MTSSNVVSSALPVMLVMPTHQREDVFRLPITLLGKTAKKWIELRKEHGIGDQDFADLLMHRYESTSHLFVPVPSVSGSSTVYTFNGPIGVDKHSKLTKKRAKKSQEIIVAPKPLRGKPGRRKTSRDSDGNPPKKKKTKVEDLEEEPWNSPPSDNGSSSDSASDAGEESDEYKPEEESNEEETDEVAESEEEFEEDETEKKKLTLREGKGYKQYDTREVAKQEGFAPKPPKRPRARLQRMYWPSLTKSYQCKICSFQDSDPRLTCQHLLQQHGDNVVDLRDYLLSKPAPDFKPGITLYHVVMAEPSQLIAMAWQGNEQATEKEGGKEAAVRSIADNGNVASTVLQDQGLGKDFGLSQSEATNSLPNMAETLATVAQLEEKMMRASSGLDESQSNLAQRQLHILEMQSGGTYNNSHESQSQPQNLPEIEEPTLTPLHTRKSLTDPMQGAFVPNHDRPGVTGVLSQTGGVDTGHCNSVLAPGPVSEPLQTVTTPADKDGVVNDPDNFAQFERKEAANVNESKDSKEQEDVKEEKEGDNPDRVEGQGPDGDSSQISDKSSRNREVKSTETNSGEGVQLPKRRRGRPRKKQAEPKRARGRPKGSGSKKPKPEDLPPVKEDPFDENEFLTILMKWVKIMVSCSTCGKSLHNLGIINKKGVKISHVCRTHEGPNDGDLLCDLCGKSFMSGRGFKIHWQENHGNMERAVCQFCGKVVKGSYLSQHINRCHTNTTEAYKCAMCGKGFKSKSACDKHEVVHRTEKPFKCPYCQRGFTQQANMKHHMRQHTGEQPYRCETCSKSFTHNVSLKNHLKRQHGVDLWQMGHTGGGRPKKEKPPVETVENKPFM